MSRRRCDNCHWGQWFKIMDLQILSTNECTECHGFDRWVPKVVSHKCSCPEDLGQCVHCQELTYKV